MFRRSLIFCAVLVEMAAIDGEVAVEAVGAGDARAQERDQQRAHGRGGEGGEQELKHLSWGRATPVARSSHHS